MMTKEGMRNAANNAHRVLAALIVENRESLRDSEAELEQYEKALQVAEYKLHEFPEEEISGVAYKKQELIVKDLALKTALTKEAIAQYQQNLIDLRAD